MLRPTACITVRDGIPGWCHGVVRFGKLDIVASANLGQLLESDVWQNDAKCADNTKGVRQLFLSVAYVF